MTELDNFFAAHPPNWAKVKRYFNDAEIQEVIAVASNNFSNTFFYKNDSKLNLDDLRLYFCSLLPSVKYQTNKDYKPHVLCGYEQNRAKKPVERAIHTRYINIKAVPYGYNHDHQLLARWLVRFDQQGPNSPWNFFYTLNPFQITL